MNTLTIDFTQDLDDVRCPTDDELGQDIVQAHQTWSRRYALIKTDFSMGLSRSKNNPEYQYLQDLKEARTLHRQKCGVCQCLGKR